MKKRVHFTDNYLLNPQHPVTVNLIGAGGTGSQVLTCALESGKVLGYGGDVLANEPPQQDNVLIKQERAIITPHISWASRQARLRLLDIAVDNLQKFVDGKIQNCVWDK